MTDQTPTDFYHWICPHCGKDNLFGVEEGEAPRNLFNRNEWAVCMVCGKERTSHANHGITVCQKAQT